MLGHGGEAIEGALKCTDYEFAMNSFMSFLSQPWPYSHTVSAQEMFRLC